jgi:hypothetical protein
MIPSFFFLHCYTQLYTERERRKKQRAPCLLSSSSSAFWEFGIRKNAAFSASDGTGTIPLCRMVQCTGLWCFSFTITQIPKKQVKRKKAMDTRKYVENFPQDLQVRKEDVLLKIQKV